jgi:hypothetical protein
MNRFAKLDSGLRPLAVTARAPARTKSCRCAADSRLTGHRRAERRGTAVPVDEDDTAVGLDAEGPRDANADPLR